MDQVKKFGERVVECIKKNPKVVAGVGVGVAALSYLTNVMDCDAPTYFASTNEAYFKGKVVWITGASSGLGLGLAKRVGACGARVVLSARNEEKLNAVKDEIEKSGGKALVVPIDLSKIEQLREDLPNILITIKNTFGAVDILVNNAGISQRTRAWENSDDQDITMVNLNFTSAVLLVKAVVGDMIERKAGQIVNISSIAAPLQPPTRSMYCANKAATIAYHNSLRWELSHDNVTVTNILPGPCRTSVDLNSCGKGGSTYGKKDPLMLTGMQVDRACELIARAISNRVDESWPTINPFLTALYLGYYIPSMFRFRHNRALTGKMKIVAAGGSGL